MHLDRPAESAKLHVIDGILVGVLPNGTIDLGHNSRLRHLHAIARDLDLANAWRMPDVATVVGHGEKDSSGETKLSVEDLDGNLRLLGADELAAIITTVRPELPPNIYLNVCYAGAAADGFARQLADQLKRVVRASPGSVTVTANEATADDIVLPTTNGLRLEGPLEQYMTYPPHMPLWYDFHPDSTRITTVRVTAFAEIGDTGLAF